MIIIQNGGLKIEFSILYLKMGRFRSACPVIDGVVMKQYRTKGFLTFTDVHCVLYCLRQSHLQLKPVWKSKLQLLQNKFHC